MAILISTKDKSSQTSEGLVRLSTDVEASEGLRNDLAVTPAGLKAALDALVDGAPAALDTLNELAAAMNDDASFFATVNSDISDLQTQINTLAGGDLSGLQDEIDDTQVGAGLGSDGSYTAPSGSNYLTSATSLYSADGLLDAQIKANADAIATLGNGNLSALQTEIDAVESSVGINSDGTFTAQSGNYISSATSVRGEISALDTQIKSNADDIANLASSSAITALQSELDASQASVGLSTSGAYVSRSGTNYLDTAASVVGEITLLDTQIKTNADAIALKAAASDVSSIDTRLTTAEGEIDTLQTEMDAVEASVALKADDSDLTALASRVTTAEGEIDTLQTESADYESRITSLESGSSNTALQTEIDAVEASVGINTDGSFTANTSGNYIGSATSVRGEINALDVQLKSTQDDLDTAETSIASLQSDVSGKASSVTVSALQSEVDSVESSVGLGTDGSFTANSGGNYISGASSVRGEINALDTQVATNAGDISNLSSTVSTLTSGSSSNASDIAALQSEVDTTQVGAGLGTTGAYAANSGSNYITSATSLKDADDKLDAQIKTNADAIALKADSSTVSALSSTVSGHTTDISDNASNIATNTADIASNLSAIQSNDSDIASLQSSKADASTVSTLQSEVDAIESAAGLNTDGSFTAPTGTNYLGSITTLKGGLSTLDTQIKSNADAISSNDTDIAQNASDITSLETLADTHESSIGLNSDGSYSAISAANYATSSSSLKAAVAQLDTQAKTNADAISAETSARQSADSTLTSSISTLQSEVDATQTGAGLDSSGGYTANSGTNYLASATSLKDADEKLDSQVKTNADAIASNDSDISSLQSDVATKASSSSVSALQTEVDAIESGVGLSASGAYSTPASSNYLGGSTVKAELVLLDTQLASTQGDLDTAESDITALESLADTHEASIGLSASGAYVGRSGSNYLDTASSVVGEATLLDAQIKTNADAIALKASSSSVSALQTEVDNVESAVGLATDGTFSSFSGQNYLNSATTIKGGMELLDAAIKTRQDNIDSEASTRASQDNVLSGKIDTVEASVGLQADGSLSITGTNYLNSSTSIVYALDVLDTNQKFLADVQANVKTSAGLTSTGTLTAYSSTNYISGSLKAAIEALDAQVKSNADDITGLGGTDISNLQTELDDTQTAVGLDSNGDYVSRSGTNYLDSATNVVGEITALDTQVKTNADNIALKANSTTLSALDLRVTQLEIGDGGILLDHASDDAVEMDDTISQFQSKSGPFQISLASLVSSGTTDLVFFGSKGERDGDRHFAIHPTSGDAIFAGKHS
jgi:hypothetical protein